MQSIQKVVAVATLLGVVMGMVNLLQSRSLSASDKELRRGIIQGTVRSAEGDPLYGILVKAIGDGNSYDTAVFTGENGRYEFPLLSQGRYRVSAGTAWQQVVALDSTRATQDFTVKLGLGFLNQTTGVSWLQAFPGTEEEKTRLSATCGSCHGIVELINKAPRAAERWADAMKQMAFVDVSGNPLPPGQPPRLDLSQRNVEVVSQYLARIIRPEVIEKSILEAIVRPRREAARAVFVEWDTNWDIPERDRFVYRSPTYTWVGPQGAIWFSWHNGATGTDGIGRIDPRSREIQKWAYSIANSLFHDMAGDAQGNIWVNGSNIDRIIKFDAKTHQFKDWILKTRYGRRPHTGDFDPDGNYWATLNVELPDSPGGYGSVIKLDPRTGDITEYPTKTKRPGNYGLVADHNGNVWFGEYSVSKLGRIDRTGKLTEYTPPTAGAGARRVKVDSKGRVWFSEYHVDKIAMLDPDTGEMAEYDIGTRYNSGQPYSIGVDKSGQVWFGLWSGNSLARFDPETKQFTFYLLPSGSFPRDIWFDNTADRPGIVYGVAERPIVGRMYVR